MREAIIDGNTLPALSQLDDQRERKAPTVAVKSAHGKPLNVSIEPIDLARLKSAFGTAEPNFANLMLSNIINAACDGNQRHPPGSEDVNRALAAVSGIGARDETEGMLATQMVTTHFAAMSVLRRLKGSETIPQQDSNGNLAAKLLRTFTMQVEALQRYRGKGQQKVTVEHVHVHGGGQAIVGAVNPGGGRQEKSKDQPHAPSISYESGTPMRRPDPERGALPISGGKRKAPV
jgi:hypothetical protein